MQRDYLLLFGRSKNIARFELYRYS
jgi:hypothetical protein